PAATAPAAGAAPAASAAPAAAPAVAPMSEVDVAQVLGGLAAQRSDKLNWQTSIVDLLKLLDLDSSLDSRKQLAAELQYSGDTNDSATMNIWLQKQVMQKLEQNGGKVPAELK
ncbi:MAG: DUF3597 domain-containing protein, partial [Janthinobacterium lividum]